MSMHKSLFSGFTLIETMVAITILTLSIVGPLITADRSIIAAETARDQLTASYLAQEGIEYVRGVRDDAFLADQTGGAWNDFLNGTVQNPIDPNLSSCRTGICTLGPLQLVGGAYTLHFCAAGFSGCSPIQFGAGTQFTRTIQLTTINPNEERVTSTVTWVFRGSTYSVSINDHLTSWQ